MMIGIGTPSSQRRIERPMTFPFGEFDQVSNRAANCHPTFRPGDHPLLSQQDSQRRLRSEGIELATGQGGRQLCVHCLQPFSPA
jgi:hypothetical protein